MPSEDWSTHIKIDRRNILEQLDRHYLVFQHKLVLRFYTIKPSGTRLMVNGICSVLHKSLTYFVYGEDKIADDPIWAGANAGGYFGLKDPQTDGKYGELLLFVLVESVLGCKMVAHKIKSLSNRRDQVKGGDGIFIGNYEHDGLILPAYLIGESKVTGNFALALKEAMQSIDKFHKPGTGPAFLDNELIVAQEFISESHVNLDELYERLTPGSRLFQEQVLVHPILLMYNTQSFEKFERAAIDPATLSAAIGNELSGKEQNYLRKISKQCEAYPNLKKVFLDFFVIPCNSVDEFRDAMYEKIHHVPYQRS